MKTASQLSHLSKLQKVQYLKTLKGENGEYLTSKEIALFMLESGQLKKPGAAGNFANVKATLAEVNAGVLNKDYELTTTHEDKRKTLDAWKKNAEETRKDGTKFTRPDVSDAVALKRFKKHLRGKGAEFVSEVTKDGVQMFKTKEPFIVFDSIEASIDKVRQLVAEGNYATDRNHATKVDNMERDIMTEYNTVLEGDAGPQFDTPVEPSAAPVSQEDPLDTFLKEKDNYANTSISQAKIYDPKDNHANAIDKTHPDYDKRLDGLGLDEMNNQYRTEIV